MSFGTLGLARLTDIIVNGDLELGAYKLGSAASITTAGAVNAGGDVISGGNLQADAVIEKTATAGVTVAGSKIYGGDIRVDTVSELTADHGTIVDGVELKDNAGTFDKVTAAALEGAGYVWGLVAAGVFFTGTQARYAHLYSAEISIHKYFELVVTRAGTFNIKWLMAYGTYSTGDTHTGRIYKNGAPFGALQTNTTPNHVKDIEENLAFAVGDTMEFWAGTVTQRLCGLGWTDITLL